MRRDLVGLRRRDVVARHDDDVETGRLGEPRDRGDVALHLGQGAVDDGAPAGVAKVPELARCDIRVLHDEVLA